MKRHLTSRLGLFRSFYGIFCLSTFVCSSEMIYPASVWDRDRASEIAMQVCGSVCVCVCFSVTEIQHCVFSLLFLYVRLPTWLPHIQFI